MRSDFAQKAFDQYHMHVGQEWFSADGADYSVKIVDVDTFAFCDDVVIQSVNEQPRRIDIFKLTYRYNIK